MAMQERYDALMREHGGLLWRIVCGYAAPGADRDDLMQEVALAVWRALPAFRGLSQPRTYLVRIAHNRGATFALQRSRRERPAEEADLDVVDPRTPDDPFEALARREALYGAVRALPIGQRQAVLLALEGWTREGIADALGIQVPAVDLRLHRARKILKTRLRKEDAPWQSTRTE